MNVLLRALRRLGLYLEIIEVRDRFETAIYRDADVLFLPASGQFKGFIETDLPVVLAGALDGSIVVHGTGSVDVLEGASVRNGMVSADAVTLKGVCSDVGIDVNTLHISETSGVAGDSYIRYNKLEKHLNSDVEGAMNKRKEPRRSSWDRPVHTFNVVQSDTAQIFNSTFPKRAA
jgi:cytoskeletal protein CcmA (bactofilin family)